jgi:hypothetical protein
VVRHAAGQLRQRVGLEWERGRLRVAIGVIRILGAEVRKEWVFPMAGELMNMWVGGEVRAADGES